MSGTISLSKSLRTPKVYPNSGNFADSFRIFVSNPTCDIRDFRMEQYGRPASIYGGLATEAPGVRGCLSPEYRIMWENALRPQYGEYLNVPAGLMMTQSEYQNQPHTDMMGYGRDRAGVFNVDGVYKRFPYPSKAVNPNSDKDNLEQMFWYENQMLGVNENRMFQNSAELNSGF